MVAQLKVLPSYVHSKEQREQDICELSKLVNELKDKHEELKAELVRLQEGVRDTLGMTRLELEQWTALGFPPRDRRDLDKNDLDLAKVIDDLSLYLVNS